MTAVAARPSVALGDTGIGEDPVVAFDAIGCHHRVHVTRAEALAEAGRVARALVDDLDRAASRFRADSEVRRIAALAPLPGLATVTVRVSALLASCVAAALHAARLTDGLVDPTLGRAMERAGYDDDLESVRRRAARPALAPAPARSMATAPRTRPVRHAADLPRLVLAPLEPPVTWRDVVLRGRVLTVPAGTLLDLGATAKAHAADLLAARLAEGLPGGFLVNLGGDVAVGGEVPPGGWEVGVRDAEGVVRQVVTTTGQGLATSSTRLRTWQVGAELRHHVLDPRTGDTAPTTWAQVSCAGATCVEANAASTAAIVLGEAAPAWLGAQGVPARLDGADGRVTTTHGWPDPA
ncbi:FAD:protein FMN transferase [Lapillicoccus jejuensis]|uniref:FAD:protein FMN transferase n=1 Tax=Lapillicoccus jejuensis TaxID=402171 RepID=A0A542DVL8_9MICO|nr:FAD:protein FMN transferase [Lapillicoccus jejuensis]TQJ07137.1 thiamine biosynthesis lipoprotein [Lapillicoccus jejuensis]